MIWKGMECMGKLEKLRQALIKYNIDAMIISSPINRRYLTGFTGSAGVAIVSQNDAHFITDFRYTKQATEQATDFAVIEHKQLIELEIRDQLNALNIKRVGFEK